jgi:Ca2+-binding RTX toxin-like protein
MRSGDANRQHTENAMFIPPQPLPAGLPLSSPPQSQTLIIPDIWGTSGDDTLYAGSNVPSPLLSGLGSTIHGGDGQDTIYGGAGADHLFGDSGNDTLYGGDNNDVLDGGTGNDTLWGGSGNDQLYGGSDNDTLHGGDNDDMLDGGAGNDTLYGDDGNDRIVGGPGVDVMTGGAGADTFAFNSASDAPVVTDLGGLVLGDPNKMDTITDFNPAEGDKIDLRGMVNEAGGLSHVSLWVQPPNFGAINGVGHDLIVELMNNDSQQLVTTIHVHTADAHDWAHDVSSSWFIL